jgi:hypothetical protein
MGIDAFICLFASPRVKIDVSYRIIFKERPIIPKKIYSTKKGLL